MTDQYVYGLHAVKALLTNPHRHTKKLYINQERVDHRLEELLELATTSAINIERLPMQKINQLFPKFKHQGVIASTDAPPYYGENNLPSLLTVSKKPSLILILDGITDPHNLGACLRSADATGVDFVLIPKDKNANLSPIVSKVACGAAESVPLVRVTNLVRAMEILKQEGIWIHGATSEADKTLYDMDCKSSSIALVMGSEGDGLRRLTKEHCDDLFSLPMLGSVESLNVSVATGICLYEVVRQRRCS